MEDIKAAESKLVLVERGTFGDKWVYEKAGGKSAEMETCGIPLLDRCYESGSLKLTYPLFSTVEKDGKVSGAKMGERLHCRKPPALPWEPELICALI